MSTPIENNTEGLLEILQTVNNLPEAGSGVRNQDITITENGTYTAENGYTGLGEVTVEIAELPNAEDATFGVRQDYEHGIISISNIRNTSNLHYGMKFKANTAFAVVGLGFYARNTGGHTLTLYDADTQAVLERMTVSPTVTEQWVYYNLPSPRNLVAGKTYMLSNYTSGQLTDCTSSYVQYNSKITVSGSYYSRSASAYPNTSISGSTPAIDMLIGDPVTDTGTAVTEYKVQLVTMDSIAGEVMRITGASGKLSTVEIVTALQGIESAT